MAELLALIADRVRTVFDQLVDWAAGVFDQLVDAANQVAAMLDPCREILLDSGAPALPRRPPTRINPCTGLNTTPLGRPLFRPSRY